MNDNERCWTPWTPWRIFRHRPPNPIRRFFGRFYYALGSQVSVRSAFESAQQVLRVDPDPKASTIDLGILRMADGQSIYHPFWIPLIIILSL